VDEPFLGEMLRGVARLSSMGRPRGSGDRCQVRPVAIGLAVIGGSPACIISKRGVNLAAKSVTL
jgi:hypothetical protein